MSRSKEAIMIVLDASVSMREPLAEITRKVAVGSRFDAAKTAVQSILSQKMLFRKHDEVGIVMYGTEDTDNPLNEQGGEYQHVKVLTYLDEASMRVAELMAKAEPAHVETKADLLDGIIVALDIMIRRTEKKKYEKRLVVITDAATPINNPADMEVVCTMIKNMEVELQIIGIDFTTTDGTKEEPCIATSQSVKVENEKMLHSIAQEVSGEVISVTKRIDFLTQGKTKTVSQSTKFRGNLEFGDALHIPVYVFSKTLEQKMPTLAKESTVADPGVGKVKMDRLYHSQSKPDEEVPPESRIKAYKYGSEMIPFSTADQASLKLATERSLKVLGFIQREQIDQSMFMGSTDAVFGDFTKPRAQEALAAFVRATEAEGKVALARFVWRANAAPKVVVLIPNAYGSLRLNCFWMQVLPFEEDLRQYEFPSLRVQKAQPTKEQQDIADSLVDALTLTNDKQNLHEKAFCPSLQRFYDTVPLRAMDPASPLASLPPYVERYVREDKELFSKALAHIQEFNKSFQLKEAVKAKDKKKKFFWSDTNKKTDDSVKEEVNEDAAPEDDEEDFDLDDLLGAEDITSVGSMNPISDFEALLSAKQNKIAKAHSAVTGMQDVITTLFSQDTVYHSKALQCLKHFRRRSPEIQYSTSFNAFLHELKEKIYLSAAWSLLVSNEMSLISSKDDPGCEVTPSEAHVFLHGAAMKEEAPAVADAPMVEAEEDDFHKQVDSWNGGYKESNLDCVGFTGAVAGVLDNTVIVLGGRETPGEDFNESSLVLLFDLNLEKNLTDYDVQGSFSRRIGHAAAVLHTKASLYVFGGKAICDDSFCHQCLDDLIKVTYSQRILRIEQMTRKGNDESPPARAWHSMTCVKFRPAPDAAAQKTKGQVSTPTIPIENEEAVLLMGGRAQGQQALKDVWIYTFIKAEDSEALAPKWIKLNTEGTSPLPLVHHSTIALCDGEKVIVFGGIKAGSSHYNELISILDLSNGIGAWSTLAASSPLSYCFQKALFVQIPLSSATNSVFPQSTTEELSAIDRIIVFGGQNPQGHTDFTAFYLLDPATGATEAFHGHLAIQSAMGHAVVADEKKRKIYVFGGTNVDYSWRNSSSVIDLWQYQYEPAPDMSRFEKIRTFEYPNGDVYIGELDPDTDIRRGLGRCVFKDGRVYEGHWSQDKFDGAGVMTYANGDIYDGTWKLGLRDGAGKLTISADSTASMVYYDGEWQRDLRHGTGALGNRDGSVLRGTWSNDVFEVASAVVDNFVDCGVVGMYEGEVDITTNLPSGHGRFESLHYPKSGEMYVGHWAQGKRDGEGMCMLFDGTIYQGEWKNGKRNGFGKCDFARTRDRYEGKWVGGQRCGQGKCTYAAGFIYEGHWAADQRHGHGRCTYTDGTMYEGLWKMDAFCGDGALLLNN